MVPELTKSSTLVCVYPLDSPKSLSNLLRGEQQPTTSQDSSAFKMWLSNVRRRNLGLVSTASTAFYPAIKAYKAYVKPRDTVKDCIQTASRLHSLIRCSLQDSQNQWVGVYSCISIEFQKCRMVVSDLIFQLCSDPPSNPRSTTAQPHYYLVHASCDKISLDQKPSTSIQRFEW